MGGEPPGRKDEFVELELTSLDEGRVWWEDSEADVGPGNDAYVDLIAGLARISRGTLAPTSVVEMWAGDKGSVRARIELASGTVEIAPRYLDDYLDVETVLVGLNATLPSDEPRFALHTPFDRTAFVTCVTEVERRRLEVRGWSFAALPAGPEPSSG